MKEYSTSGPKILPSRGGDWKLPGYNMAIVELRRSSPRGEVTGNRHALLNDFRQDDPPLVGR